jgi:hypothetical protein
VINHRSVHYALRTKLLTLEVATVTASSIEATATGYSRASGSFLTDGFLPGMEVTGTGFSDSDNNTAKTLTGVTATTLTCSGCGVEAAGTRTLSVDLPQYRAWENVRFTPTTTAPWVQETYLPGPMSVIESGSLATLEVLPQYVVQVAVPQNMGMDVSRAYTDALLTLFAPGTRITVSGATVIVRENPAPYVGQLIRDDQGFAVAPVTIPLRLTTANTV